MNPVEIRAAVDMMRSYANMLDGESEDLTNVGYQQILIYKLENALNVKIITPEQYEAFVALVNKDMER